MAKIANQNLVAYGIHNGLLPTDGPKSLAIPLDFSSNTSYDIEFETAAETGRLSYAQCVYIDNSIAVAQTLELACGESQQVIKVKGASQGFYPLLLPSTKFTITASAVIALAAGKGYSAMLILLNVPMPGLQWPSA